MNFGRDSQKTPPARTASRREALDLRYLLEAGKLVILLLFYDA